LTILRQAASAARNASRARTFTSTSASRKDFVQDLYVKELKAYKAPPAPKDAHVGVVKIYTAPSPPKPPVLPSDLASELSAYDASEPAKAEVSKKTATTHGEDIGTGADAYLEFLEQDPPKAEEAHH